MNIEPDSMAGGVNELGAISSFLYCSAGCEVYYRSEREPGLIDRFICLPVGCHDHLLDLAENWGWVGSKPNSSGHVASIAVKCGSKIKQYRLVEL